MKKKHIKNLIIYLMFIFFSISFVGCKSERRISSSPTDLTTNAAITSQLEDITYYAQDKDFVSYCAKQADGVHSIYFNYPLFKQSVTNSDRLNQIILTFVQSNFPTNGENGFNINLMGTPEKWDWFGENYTDAMKRIDYEITYYDSSYISVLFKGIYGARSAAHQTNFIDALLIDLKTEQRIGLNDLYDIDQNFITVIKEEYTEQMLAFLEEKGIQNPADYMSALNEFMVMDQINTANFPVVFLTEKKLGIVIFTTNMIGDHAEIYIDYDKLEPFKK